MKVNLQTRKTGDFLLTDVMTVAEKYKDVEHTIQ